MVLGQHPRQRCKIPSKYKTLELRLYDKCTCFFSFTYRLELLCDAVKTLRLARPAATIALALSGHACSAEAWAVSRSLVGQPPTAEATSRRVRGLRTKFEAASSSSSSSTTRRSQWRFGARLLEAEPWPVNGPRVASPGLAGLADLRASGLKRGTYG